MREIIAVLSPLYVSGFWALVFLIVPAQNNRARHFLGVFMGTAFFLYLGHFLYFQKFFWLYSYYDAVYTLSSMMVYPMYYQYIRLLSTDVKWDFRYLYHYLPALFFALVTLVVNMSNRDLVFSDSKHWFSGSLPPPGHNIQVIAILNPWFILAKRIFFAVQVVVYMFWGFQLIRHHRQRVLNFYSNAESKSITWVKVLNISLVVTSLFSLVFNIIGRNNFLVHAEYLVVPAFLFSSMLFVIGYLGNGQNQVIREILQDQEQEQGHNSAHPTGKPPNNLQERLEELFRVEKIYLNSDLKIWDVSVKLGTNRTYISNLINKNYGVNFSGFVNRYRVEEALTMLRGSDSALYSLDTISEKCGFGSLNNFIRVFKEFQKITPGRYREDILAPGRK